MITKNNIRIFGLLMFFAAGVAKGFVMIGPVVMPAEAVAVLNVNGANVNVALNITDDLGGPKEIDRFYRWNVPDLTYSFDDSFVRYFGLEGVNAVNDAIGVMNDFFEMFYMVFLLMHFIVDGFIWKFRSFPELKAILVEEGDDAPGLGEVSA